MADYMNLNTRLKEVQDMSIELVFPSDIYQAEVLDYKNEFMRNNESMDGTGGLEEAEDFETWYLGICSNLSESTVRHGFVPATTWLAVNSMDKGRIIGMIDIRHRLNDYLLNFGGHIGYSVRKSERRKGYAVFGIG